MLINEKQKVGALGYNLVEPYDRSEKMQYMHGFGVRLGQGLINLGFFLKSVARGPTYIDHQCS